MITVVFWAGILMMALGGGLLLWTDLTQQVSGMVTVACLLALGFLLSAGAKVVLIIRRTA
ncbi:hypothetical protein [Ferrimonas balearica]|uniref:hypothetical protein n=1 Tax=Ferrimonas balearica TaxID=44012 RepID=UPI001C98F623|nr:hypothetical protein [Ferrimonas balearica]MBY5920160.1 hypothetical protein [Ferrimonas balearica]MBY5997155.1 hypothetical protein [Ferrimonas balearica]